MGCLVLNRTPKNMCQCGYRYVYINIYIYVYFFNIINTYIGVCNYTGQKFIFCKFLETNQRIFSKSCQTIQPTPRHTAPRINSVSCSTNYTRRQTFPVPNAQNLQLFLWATC